MPQLPRTANDGVRVVMSPCRSAVSKDWISRVRPMKFAGLAGKLGSGSMTSSRNSRSSIEDLEDVDFLVGAKGNFHDWHIVWLWIVFETVVVAAALQGRTGWQSP